MKSLFHIALLTISLFIIAGCRSGRVLPQDKIPNTAESENNLMSTLDQSNSRFRTMKTKRALIGLITRDGKKEVNGNIAVYRDSLVVVSIIPALGYEAFRVLCTKDSVIAINRIEKSYSASSLEHYMKKYNIPFGFEELQAMIINEVFYYKNNLENRDYSRKLNKTNGENIYLIEAYREEKRLTRQGVKVDSTGMKFNSLYVIDYEEKLSLTLDYKDFSYNGSFQFPGEVSLEVSDSTRAINLDIQYGETVFDDSINVEFNVPPNYNREDL